MKSPFVTPVQPDWKAFVDCIMRRGTPRRVHHIELFLDAEVQELICQRYGPVDDLSPDDPHWAYKRQIRIQRFLGYDYVRCGLDDWEMPLNRILIEDTAEAKRAAGRNFQDEHRGPITTWAEFESYPWPDPDACATRTLDWYSANLPDDMCLIASGGFAHFAEYLTWLMGYETCCYALYDQRDLVTAIAQRLIELYKRVLERLLAFERVKVVWGSDDMGFKTSTLLSPKDTREFILPGHKLMASMSHAAGRPYLLHACGNLETIMEDLIEDVRIDAKHSFEDTIETAIEAKRKYGDRIAILGGIDLDFMCRASEDAIRQRVRETLDACLPGGGYLLGTGNSVANYIPVDHYLAMVDEGRNYTR